MRMTMENLPKKDLNGQNPIVTLPTKQALNQFEAQQKTRPTPPAAPNQQKPGMGGMMGGPQGPMGGMGPQGGMPPQGMPPHQRMMNPNGPPMRGPPMQMQGPPGPGMQGPPMRMHQGPPMQGPPMGPNQQGMPPRFQNQWNGPPRGPPNGIMNRPPGPGQHPGPGMNMPPNGPPGQMNMRPQMNMPPNGPMRGPRPDWNRPPMHQGTNKYFKIYLQLLESTRRNSKRKNVGFISNKFYLHFYHNLKP
jgi:cleavage and polyadenylation specificity factor subunit 6/7